MSIKKILSLVLALVMVLSMIPAVSAAETEPEANTPVVVDETATEPEASEPETEDPSIEWIEIANEEQWDEWFGNYNKSGLLTKYGDGTPVYFKLTESFEITCEKLQYIGHNTGPKVCKVTIDLNGQTLTYNKAEGATAATRFMGVYGSAETSLLVKNGTIINNAEYDGATGGVFFSNNGTLTLENVTITDTSDNAYSSSGKLVGGSKNVNLIGCTFNVCVANSTGKGGAVAVTGGTWNITDCTFNAIRAEESQINAGGLFYISSGTATLTNCVFNGGKAEYGAQVYVDTVLNDKGAVKSYGTLTMNNCQLNGGEAPFGTVGVDGKAVLTMNGGYVANGVAKTYTTTDAEGKETTVKAKGGNFYIYNEESKNTAPVVTLNDVTIQDGSCDNIGGNIYASNKNAYAGPQLTLNNCTVTGGNGKNGGNFGVTSAANVTITGGSITNGKSSNGAQVWFWNDTSRSVKGALNMTDVTLSGGVATGEGGAIYTHADDDRAAPAVTLNNCVMENNTAKTGGAVYVYNTTMEEDATNVTLNNCTIKNCSAQEGGALAISRTGAIAVEGGTIEGCTATVGNGGAIYAYNGHNKVAGPKYILKDLTIKDCTAPKYAGGIYMSNGAKYMPGQIIAENVTLDGNKSLGIADNKDSFFGGNMYFAGQSYTEQIETETTNEAGETVKETVDGETFIPAVTFTNSTIKNGVADGFGGNIGMAGAAQVTLIGCTVENGKTLGQLHPESCGGGNLYMGNSNAKLTLLDTDFIGGESALHGGNIRIGGGVIVIDQGSTIIGGVAAQGGQTIHLNDNDNTYVTLYDGQIIATAVAAPADDAAEGEEIEIVPCESVKVNGEAHLHLINGTVSGFDAEAYTVEAKSYAVSNEDGSYTIKHYAVDGATTKTGSCEEAGTVTIECAECARTFVYEEAAAGHAIVVDKAVAATCTEAGLTEGQHCAICNVVLVAQEVVPANGHTAAEAVKENEVAHTCTEAGSYDLVVYCEVCKAELERTVGVVDPAAHTEQIVEGKDATCTEDGLTDGVICSVCGETLTAQETIPAAHTEQTVEGKAPTCTETGLTDGVICSVCGETLTAQEEIPVAEHAWNEGVYTEPTTEADGFTTFTCTACGETKVEVNEGSKLPEVIPSEITKQPESVTVETGTDAVFHVEVTGEVVSYKWEYRQIWKWFNTGLTGYNTDTLTVPAKATRNGYDYRCVITFADGTVLTTEPAELTVNTYITVQNPNDQTVVTGYKGQFSVVAEGENLKYQWQYKRPDGERWIDTAMEGSTTPTVYIESTNARDGYQYRCVITDGAKKQVISEPATMRVLFYTAHPVETFATTGEVATMSVQTSVADGFRYEWYYSKNNGATWAPTTMEGYNTDTLVISTKGKNGYMYKCILTGSKNSKLESKIAVLNVGDPIVINQQPQSLTATAADTVLFTVDATNVYSYQWYYSKTEGEIWAKTTAEGNTTATLTIAAKNKNNYWYKCEMKGLNGEIVQTEIATLTVQ